MTRCGEIVFFVAMPHAAFSSGNPVATARFSGAVGCRLPLEMRPLVCRLYPYDYTADGIQPELSPGCPVELLTPGQGLIEALEMRQEDAALAAAALPGDRARRG